MATSLYITRIPLFLHCLFYFILLIPNNSCLPLSCLSSHSCPPLRLSLPVTLHPRHPASSSLLSLPSSSSSTPPYPFHSLLKSFFLSLLPSLLLLCLLHPHKPFSSYPSFFYIHLLSTNSPLPHPLNFPLHFTVPSLLIPFLPFLLIAIIFPSLTPHYYRYYSCFSLPLLSSTFFPTCCSSRYSPSLPRSPAHHTLSLSLYLPPLLTPSPPQPSSSASFTFTTLTTPRRTSSHLHSQVCTSLTTGTHTRQLHLDILSLPWLHTCNRAHLPLNQHGSLYLPT